MVHEVNPSLPFPGFPDFRANVTFTPIQFFTVVIPHCSHGTICLVGYVLRKLLGWVDEHGNPTQEQLRFSYPELVEQAGLSRGAVVAAINEALKLRLLCRLPATSPQAEHQQVEGAIYGLCWDPSDQLTHDPAEFGGFYYPEASVVEEQNGNQVVRRPKAARKNIPNAFFDYLLPRERRSVIRIVGALLFKSIQWGPGGERRVPVSCSITELSRLTRTSRRHVHAAIGEACQRGYLEQVDAGCFDPAAGQASRPATYGIRWAKSLAHAQTAVAPPGAETLPATPAEAGQFKKVNGASVQKGKRDQYKKVNGKEYKKVNGINIKTELKTELKTTAVGSGLPAAAPDPAAAVGFDLLVKAGFDAPTARLLASRHYAEVIQRQTQWLPLRGADRNRLGLLRRAIEQDWPKPSGAEEDAGLQQGHRFASHYYAGYHGYAGEAATDPFPKDVALAAKFVARLLAWQRNEALIPEWGRRFGRFMRDKHQGDARAKPNLCLTLVLFGDAFLRQLEQEGAARRQEALGKAQAAHEAAFMPAYLAYVGLAEKSLQQANPDLYQTFAADRQRLRKMLFSGPFMTTAERQESFDREDSRLFGFAEFFAQHPQHRVWSFWDWDRRLNPHRLGGGPPGRNPNQEVRA